MRSPDALARGQAAGYARLASSKSWTASWLFPATAVCAPRVSRSTLARACANSSGSPSHHSASEAIASSARSGCPWTYSARYSANDATTRACRRDSSGCMASGQLKPVGVCVDILRPLCRPAFAFARSPGTENSCSQIARKAITSTKVSRVVQAGTVDAVDAGGEKAGRVLGISRLPFLPAGSPAFWGGEDSLGSYPKCLPLVKRRVAPSVRGLDGVLRVPVLDGFARWRNTILSACVGFSEDLFRLHRGIVAPSLALLRQEGFGSPPHSLFVLFVTHDVWSTRLRPMRCDPRERSSCDARTGRPAVEDVCSIGADDPRDPDGPDADLIVRWGEGIGRELVIFAEELS